LRRVRDKIHARRLSARMLDWLRRLFAARVSGAPPAEAERFIALGRRSRKPAICAKPASTIAAR